MSTVTDVKAVLSRIAGGLPAAVAGAIVLPPNTEWQFSGSVNIGTDHIVLSEGTILRGAGADAELVYEGGGAAIRKTALGGTLIDGLTLKSTGFLFDLAGERLYLESCRLEADLGLGVLSGLEQLHLEQCQIEADDGFIVTGAPGSALLVDSNVEFSGGGALLDYAGADPGEARVVAVRNQFTGSGASTSYFATGLTAAGVDLTGAIIGNTWEDPAGVSPDGFDPGMLASEGNAGIGRKKIWACTGQDNGIPGTPLAFPAINTPTEFPAGGGFETTSSAFVQGSNPMELEYVGQAPAQATLHFQVIHRQTTPGLTLGTYEIRVYKNGADLGDSYRRSFLSFGSEIPTTATTFKLVDLDPGDSIQMRLSVTGSNTPILIQLAELCIDAT